jgi:hypothetical protein
MNTITSIVVAATLILAPPTAITLANSASEPGPKQTTCDGHDHTHTAEHHAKWANKLKGGYSIPSWAKEKHRHSVQCAAGPNHRSVMKARWAKVKRSQLPPNHDLWIAIGRCEQPGSGYRGINWSHTGPTYQGGLGFWYGTWSGYKYPSMPSNAGYATWRQQMKVANRLLALYGTSPWGCA